MKIDINFKPQTSKDYTIFIDELGTIDLKGKVAIITNHTISRLHLKRIKELIRAENLHVISIEDGEEYKNLKTIEKILNQLFELKFNRNSTLIAFGGGVIGDMTGFCASIYQRGIDFVQVPTTLLAMVDASVGGKTGVNNSYGKNLIGSFYQPKNVYCQSEFLDTLPQREFSAGVAEIVKMAVVFDKDFFRWLEKIDLKNKEDLSKTIEKCVKLKAKVVAQDEKEKGLRAVLNYGHTFAHVIERQTRYKKFLHGEAVSIGMVMANKLALKLGFINENENKRIYELLKKHNLPVTYHIKDVDEFYEAFFLDKKSLDANILFILPKGIGSHSFEKSLDKDILLEVLRDFK